MRHAIDGVLADDHKQRRVDGIDAFAQDDPLPATLSTTRRLAADQEGAGVLEVIARHHAGQRLARLERLAVAGIDVADLALRDGDQPNLVDTELPSPQPEVQAAAQEIGLVARLAVERDDRALGYRASLRPELFDDADVGVRDVGGGQPECDQTEHHEGDQAAEDLNSGVREQFRAAELGEEDRHMRHGSTALTCWARIDGEGRCAAWDGSALSNSADAPRTGPPTRLADGLGLESTPVSS